jgi:hypothetical protein
MIKSNKKAQNISAKINARYKKLQIKKKISGKKQIITSKETYRITFTGNNR